MHLLPELMLQVLVGTGVVVLSVLVSGAFVLVASSALLATSHWVVRPPKNFRFFVVLVSIVLWIQLGISVIILIWAGVFYGLGLFDGFEPATYFALVSFTTLGFGDVLLDKDWRLLSGFAASNGLLLFGVFTAFFVEAMRRVRAAQIAGIPEHE